MGFFMATVLVTVNMIGTGIFLLPVSMASVGSISILGWLVAMVGAGAIGLMFSMLAAVRPEPGGPYAYARLTFGPYLGFQTNYVYWLANLVGNIAVAATVTGYLAEFIPVLKNPIPMLLCNITTIWVATAVNLAGPRFVGAITGWSTVVAMIPLFGIALFGWFWFDPAVFSAGWKPAGNNLSSFSAISQSASFALWAFMGVESASVAAGVIKNPKRNVPLATMLGLVIAATLYVLTCSVIMGIIPVEEIKKSGAPFAIAAAKAIGPAGAWIVGLAAIFKAGASLIGWTLTISQSAQAAAADGAFPRIYGVVNKRGTPVWNFIISAILMTLVVIGTASPSLTQQFNHVIEMAVVLTILPYMYSVVAFLRACAGLGSGATHMHKRIVAAIAFVACLYCLWAIGGTESRLVRSALIVVLASVPLYPFFLRQLEHIPPTNNAEHKTTNSRKAS